MKSKTPASTTPISAAANAVPNPAVSDAAPLRRPMDPKRRPVRVAEDTTQRDSLALSADTEAPVPTPAAEHETLGADTSASGSAAGLADAQAVLGELAPLLGAQAAPGWGSSLVGGIGLLSINAVQSAGGALLQKGQSSAGTSVQVHGEAAAGALVTVYSNGNAVGSAVANSAGQWSLNTPNLGSGNQALSARASLNGEQSPATGTFNFELDTTAPAQPAAVSVRASTTSP